MFFIFSFLYIFFFFQAEDGIRYLVRSRGLGDVYKRQLPHRSWQPRHPGREGPETKPVEIRRETAEVSGACGRCVGVCLLYTSDAADERSSVDLGGRRIIKKKTKKVLRISWSHGHWRDALQIRGVMRSD